MPAPVDTVLAMSRPDQRAIRIRLGEKIVPFTVRDAFRRKGFIKGMGPFQKWWFRMRGVIKICKSGRLAPTKRALAISGLGSNPPAPKKIAFRVDETQYFPGSTIRSSLPRDRRVARHKPGWQFSLVFWGFDVVE